MQGSRNFGRSEVRRIQTIVEDHQATFCGGRMATSIVELEVPGATDLALSDHTLTAELAAGRTISVPLAWYPRLVHATREERNRWELHAAGQHLHWPDLPRRPVRPRERQP